LTIETRKDFIKQFVQQGIDPDQVYILLYLTDEEIATVESDQAFQAEIKDLRMRVGLGFVQAYHNVVTSQGKPGDHLARVRSFYPEAFKTDGAESCPLDLNLTIVKKRGA
jgi:hypothetical protein